MSTRNTDVNLIVRARTEGEKAIAGLSDILATLFDDTRQGSDDIAALGKTLGALDRAATSIAGSMQKAGGAVDRQRASLAENNAAYAALLKQQAEAQRVMASFGDQQNKGFVGPRTKAFTEQFAGVRAEVDRLGTEINRTFAKIGTQAAQLDGSRSALLNLSSSSTAVAEAQRQAEAQIELTNQALAEQAAAAERVTDIQRRINRVNGVDRPDATGRAASVSDLLAAADAEFRRKEAAEAEASALRLVNNQLAERANLEAALERNTGLGRVAAADGGATTSRLAELSREIDKKEDAARAERDLAAAARATNNALAERANIERALERNTGVGRVRAIDSGATVSALTELVNEQHRAAEAIDQMDKEAEHLRATLDPMAAIQERFNTRLARFKELARAGKIEAHELAAAEEHLAIEANRAREALDGVGGGGGAPKHKIGLFGLKPYELQNLSYQVNDVVTGLASGQKATQVIAQQGGQILQLFPRVAGNLIGALKDPRIAALVVTVGALFFGMKKAADEAARLRELSGQIELRADGGSYDPKKLSEGADALERMGAKAADATAAVKVFLNEGINPDLLNTFARAAEHTAEVLGTDLPTSARQLADAFTGGFDAVAALDDKLNFLTASEREHIKALFDSGNAEAARTEALAAYARQAEDAANKQRGPWTKAALSLGNAWDALLKFIANSAPIKVTIAVLSELAGAVKSVGDAIADVLKDTSVGKPTTAGNIQRVQGEIATLEKKIADYEQAIANKAPASGTFRRLADYARNQLEAARAELKKLEQQAPDTLNNEPNGAEAKKRAERLSEINTEESLQQLRQRGQAGLSRADGLRRTQMAGEVAYRREMAATGDAIVAARLREIAVAKEQGDIDKQNEAARKAAERERERQQRERERLAKQTRFVDPVDGRSSSGFGPRSSPGGVGSKFHRGIDYAVPAGTSVRAPAAGIVIETGYDTKLGKYVLIDHGNKTQSKFGHLSDNSVVKEGQSVAQGQLIAKSGNTGSATTGAHLHYTVLVNGKPVDPRKGIFVGDGPARFEVNQGEALQDYEDALDDRQHRQDNFNLSVRHEFEERQRIIKQLAEHQGLTGAALLAEQRRQEQLVAEAELRADVENANKNLAPGLPPITISEDVIARARDLAGALFDLRSAREALDVRLDTVERPIENLEQQRNVLVEQRDLLRSIGEFKAAAAVDRDIQGLTTSIGEAYDKLIEFYRALSPADRARLRIADDAQLEAIISKLTRAKDAATKVKDSLAGGTISFRAFLESFASSAVDSFNNFFRRVAEGQNVFRSAGRAIKEFAASFTGALAQMIVKALAFAAAMYVLSAITGLSPNALAQAMQLSAGVHHAGGIAGSAGGVKRTVSPEAFRNAMRYHQGGVIGFAPDEVPAILERGEEVLPRGDPRHRANGGLDQPAGEGITSIKNVTVFDRDQAAQEILNTKTGEKAVLNIVRTNKRGLGLNI